VRRLRAELKVNTTCGASNVAFGMPNRRQLTGYFLAMAAANGMTSAIMNPLHDEDMNAIMAANVLNGVDKNCRAWIRKFREPAAPAAGTATEGAPAAVETDLDARRREREERRRRRG
jgi:5-methyltetrahydrofolate--homocysteine methyltransferase